MPRAVALLASLALLAGACSGSSTAPTTTTAPPPPPTTTAPPATTTARPATTTTPPATTTTPQPLQTTTTIGAVAGPVQPRRLGIGDEYFPDLGNPGYDVLRYQLDLTFDPSTNFLEGFATITAVATERSTSFNLDFEMLDIESIRVDGTAVEFAFADEEVTIRPPSPLSPGDEFQIEFEYSGEPGPAPSDAIGFNIGWLTAPDGSEAFVVAEPDAAHSWFPGNDHPLDKATFWFNITVPDEIIAAANGTLVSTEEAGDGFTTWSWVLDDPMATYLATVVIGEFDIVVDEQASLDAGLPIRHVLPRGTTVADWPGLERQGEMIAFMEELFGPYPFDNYGIAIVDGFQNALENQTLSIFGRRFAESPIFDLVLIHELAHHWFGNSVSPGLWRDIWLNEGFASYAEWLWLERERGRPFVDTNIASERAVLAGNGLRSPGDPLSADLFNQSVYRWGAMTLHALRLTVGDEGFFETLRTYHQRFAGATATTQDFVGVAEEVSGMDLADLFEAWLFGEAIPEFP